MYGSNEVTVRKLIRFVPQQTFENRLDPFPVEELSEPPRKLLPFCLHFPKGAWRIRTLAEGIKLTIVNGEVLIEDGEHTGALPGKVIRNALYHANKG